MLLADGDVVVRCAVLPALPASLADALIAGFGAEEQARAARLLRQRDRDLFAAVHALLRSAVAQAAGSRLVSVRYNGDGRPELEPSSEGSSLRISLSHTAGLAVCAVARGMAVGVDAEAVEPGLDILGIAAMQFAAPECATLATAAPERRERLFYRLWTLREAVLKACGQGFARPSELVIALDPAAAVASGPGGPALRWHIEERALCPTHQVALAVRWPAARDQVGSGTSIGLPGRSPVPRR